MREKLTSILASYDDLTDRLAEPGHHVRPEGVRAARQGAPRASAAGREGARVPRRARRARRGQGDAQGAETDPELKEMASAEIKSIEETLPALEDELKVMMLPGDPNDDKDIIVEIRAGAGGDEAAMFAGDLYRMYLRYADIQKWKYEEIDSSESETGGFKEVSFRIRGNKVYSKMKFESGVHRVQRVPGDRDAGPHPHLHRDRRRAPRGRRGRGRAQHERPARRRVPLLRPRRPVGQHDRLRRAHHPPADRHRRPVAEPEEPAAEQGGGDARPARPPLRAGAREAAGRAGRRRAAARSARATAPRRSAPTTTRRTGSPTTASG